MLKYTWFAISSILVLPILSYFVSSWFLEKQDFIFLLIPLLIIYHVLLSVICIVVFKLLKLRSTGRQVVLFRYFLMYTLGLVLIKVFLPLEIEWMANILGIQILFLSTVYFVKFFWKTNAVDSRSV